MEVAHHDSGLKVWFAKWLSFFFDEDVELDGSGSKMLGSEI